VPRTRAIAVAIVATMNELTSACVTRGSAIASPIQWSVKPVGGHAWMRLSLNA
jgi:hypothetical protein